MARCGDEGSVARGSLFLSGALAKIPSPAEVLLGYRVEKANSLSVLVVVAFIHDTVIERQVPDGVSRP